MKLRIKSLLQLKLKGEVHLQYNNVFRAFGYISFEFIRNQDIVCSGQCVDLLVNKTISSRRQDMF